jgi:hypothetical protein
MQKITFINNSNVLIQNNYSIILTDPRYKKPVFGSWLSISPTNIVFTLDDIILSIILTAERNLGNSYIGY